MGGGCPALHSGGKGSRSSVQVLLLLLLLLLLLPPPLLLPPLALTACAGPKLNL